VVDLEQFEMWSRGRSHMATKKKDDEKTHLHEIDFVWNFNTSNYLNINHSPLIGLLEIIHTQEPHGIPE
jgi:hypothetical protein